MTFKSVYPSLATVSTDNPFIIIYFLAVPLFLAVTMEMVSVKWSLVPNICYNLV
jgi:hypothetical protein